MCYISLLNLKLLYAESLFKTIFLHAVTLLIKNKIYAKLIQKLIKKVQIVKIFNEKSFT
jgi:hypothetical protein